MRILLASILLMMTVFVICYPIFIVFVGLFSGGTLQCRIALVVVGLILCRLVKPISILTGKDYKII